MPETYAPPDYPPFPADEQSLMEVFAPYFHEERPLDFFFEMYICDVIERLPPETGNVLSQFVRKHSDVFGECSGSWGRMVEKQLQLSDTIGVAIWDLWIRNTEIAAKDGWVFEPWHFAETFAANYLAEDGPVDVWPEGVLEAAKLRIARYRNAT